ncbi:hypothetical protein FACS189419_09430 [Planctomycetales bacterium]|nr:hypothetical protein FACS189419_09430 [Planctomycetales bacterium]
MKKAMLNCVNWGGGVLCVVSTILALFIFLLSSTANAQVVLDGVNKGLGSTGNPVLNNGNISTATLTGWIQGNVPDFPKDPVYLANNGTIDKVTFFRTSDSLRNYFYNGVDGGTGAVGTALVTAGWFYNNDGSSVGTVTTDNCGIFYNNSEGGSTRNVGIETAIINNYAVFTSEVGFYNGYDGGTGSIGTVALNRSVFYNGSDGGIGSVGIANVTSGGSNSYNYNDTGVFYNGSDGGTGSVGIANVTNNGRFYNGRGGGTGSVGTATINGGTFYNGDGGIGSVENLLFNGGQYIANYYGGTSSLTNLTLGKRIDAAQGTEFAQSNVQKLAFSADYGLITITGYDNGESIGFTNDINLTAPTIDLTGTNLQVNLANVFGSVEELGETYSFDLSAFFGGTSAILGGGEIDTLDFIFGNQSLLNVISAGVWADDWSYSNGAIVYAADSGLGGLTVKSLVEHHKSRPDPPRTDGFFDKLLRDFICRF